jgi:hypothetical protein
VARIVVKSSWPFYNGYRDDGAFRPRVNTRAYRSNFKKFRPSGGDYFMYRPPFTFNVSPVM